VLTHQDRSTKDAGSRTKSDTQITRPTTPKALTTRELARDHQNQNTARGQVAPHIGIPNGNFLRQPTCAFTTDATALARLEQSDDQRRASLSGSASSGGRSGNAGAGNAGPLPPTVTNLFPKPGANGVCLDAPRTLTFARAPSSIKSTSPLTKS